MSAPSSPSRRDSPDDTIPRTTPNDGRKNRRVALADDPPADGALAPTEATASEEPAAPQAPASSAPMEQVPPEEPAATESADLATASPAAAPQGLETEASDGVVASAAYLAGKLAVGSGTQRARIELLSAFGKLPGQLCDVKEAIDELARTTSLKDLLAYYGDAAVPEVEVEVPSAEDAEKKAYLDGYFGAFQGKLQHEKDRILKKLGVVLKSGAKTKQDKALAKVLVKKTLLELKIACGDAEPPGIPGTVDIKRKGDTQWQRFSCQGAAGWAFGIPNPIQSVSHLLRHPSSSGEYEVRWVTDNYRVAADVVLGNEDGYEDRNVRGPRYRTDSALAAAEVDARAAATAEHDAFEEARRGRMESLLRIKRVPSGPDHAVVDGDGEHGDRGARRAASAAGKAAAEAELVRRRAAGTAAFKALRDCARAERKATVEAVLEAYRPARA